MFYENLLKLCSQRGISLTHLVTKEIRMSVSNVTKWKEGKIPKSDTVQKIADYFGVTTDYLLTGSDNKKNSGINPEDEYQFALLDGAKELTDEGKKELINYLEYLKNKYKK